MSTVAVSSMISLTANVVHTGALVSSFFKASASMYILDPFLWLPLVYCWSVVYAPATWVCPFIKGFIVAGIA